MNYAQLGLEVAEALYIAEPHEYKKSNNVSVANRSSYLYTATPAVMSDDKSQISLNLLTLPSPSTTALKTTSRIVKLVSR